MNSAHNNVEDIDIIVFPVYQSEYKSLNVTHLCDTRLNMQYNLDLVDTSPT
jgi:hypothetical protein